MNENLKPCPFCGQDDSISIEKYQCEGEWWHFTECEECLARGSVGKTEQDAIDAWNERASQPMPPSVIKALEKIADGLAGAFAFCNDCPAYPVCGMKKSDSVRCKNAIAKTLARAAGWSV